MFLWLESSDGKKLYRVDGVEIEQIHNIKKGATVWALRVLCGGKAKVIEEFDSENEAIEYVHKLACMVGMARMDLPIVHKMWR